jgi:hypothetical protein
MLKAPQCRSLAGARSSLYRLGEGFRTSTGLVSCQLSAGAPPVQKITRFGQRRLDPLPVDVDRLENIDVNLPGTYRFGNERVRFVASLNAHVEVGQA